MADINPPKFSGTAVENAEMWVRHFTNFCAFKQYNDDKIKTLFKVLMADAAATWLDSLEPDTLNDWTALKAAFLARYTTPEFLNYKNARELFNSKQGDRTVDDYCAHMQRIAKQINADEKMLRFAVLNGLKDSIASYVTQKQPTDWKQLLEAARVGEMCDTTNQSQADSVVTAQLTLMQDQLRQLTTRLDTPTVAQVTEDRRVRSQSPRRVRLADERSRDYGRRPRYDNRPRSPGGWGDDFGRGGGY